MLGGVPSELEIAIPQYQWVCTGGAKVQRPMKDSLGRTLLQAC
jgi:hypothetical protein